MRIVDLFTASPNGYKRQNFILYFVKKPCPLAGWLADADSYRQGIAYACLPTGRFFALSKIKFASFSLIRDTMYKSSEKALAREEITTIYRIPFPFH